MEDLFRVTGTNLLIHVPPELDHYHAEQIKRGADRLIAGRNIRRVIFDFKKTTFMDSSGIGVIMGRYKNIRFMGGEVAAVHVNEQIKRILALSGICKLIDIYEDRPAQPEIF